MEHYTRKFGRCPTLNKIYHEDMKGTKRKGDFSREKGQEARRKKLSADSADFRRLKRGVNHRLTQIFTDYLPLKGSRGTKGREFFDRITG
jgi:hypothetical protein